MIVSLSRQFLFIHVIKVAGMSIERSLGGHDVRSQNTNPEIQAKLKALGRHASAVQLRTALGDELFDRMFKFAFVRNPWDFALSLYHFNLEHPEFHGHARAKAAGNFETYIMTQDATPAPNGQQRKLIADEKGKVMVDFVGRYETLADDFAKVREKLGVEAFLEHFNRTEHPKWQTVYNRKMFEQVRSRAKADIETFGYSARPEDYGIKK